MKNVRSAVVRWFAQAQRRLPWREGYDPYAVWVAEIMLQQTQVETVRPYFERWMARFPDVHVVAEAPEGDVLKAWEGLGYYARARNLRRAAQRIVAEHNGRMPESLDALRALPGIGRYTAGAIRSIGHGRAAPIVDGNVGRVLGRLVALDVPARSSAGERRLWTLAEALVPPENARDFNQGLMELGALLCRPTAPACLLCPLRPHCAACAQGDPERWPPAPPRRERPVRSGVMLLLRDGAGRVLLRQRPPKGLWGGLWEPPWEERAPGESAPAAARRVLDGLVLSAPDRLRATGTLEHGLTHFQLVLRCYALRIHSPPLAMASGLMWADERTRAALPLARLGRKALEGK